MKALVVDRHMFMVNLGACNFDNILDNPIGNHLCLKLYRILFCQIKRFDNPLIEYVNIMNKELTYYEVITVK